jgi:hypothetical protein
VQEPAFLELRLLSAIFERKELMAAFWLTIFSIAMAAEYPANLLAIVNAVKRRIKDYARVLDPTSGIISRRSG